MPSMTYLQSKCSTNLPLCRAVSLLDGSGELLDPANSARHPTSRKTRTGYRMTTSSKPHCTPLSPDATRDRRWLPRLAG